MQRGWSSQRPVEQAHSVVIPAKAMSVWWRECVTQLLLETTSDIDEQGSFWACMIYFYNIPLLNRTKTYQDKECLTWPPSASQTWRQLMWWLFQPAWTNIIIIRAISLHQKHASYVSIYFCSFTGTSRGAWSRQLSEPWPHPEPWPHVPRTRPIYHRTAPIWRLFVFLQPNVTVL